MKRGSRLPAVLALLPLLAQPLWARAQQAPAVPSELSVPRERSGLVFARFDADSRADLLIARESSFELRLQRADGSFAPGVQLDISESLGGALFQVADLDGDGAAELYLQHRTGVDAYRLRGGELRAGEPLLAGQRGIAYLQLSPFDFLDDLDGDGTPELIFLGDGETAVHARGPKGYAPSSQRPAPRVRPEVRMAGAQLDSRNLARLEIPRPQLREGAAPRERSILRLGNGATVTSNDGSGLTPGSFGAPSAEDDPLEPFRRRHGIGDDDPSSFQGLLRDLDGDGRHDYTIVHGSRIWVYRGDGGAFDFDRSPTQLLKVSDADQLLALLLPLNPDRRPDLVLFKYELPSAARIVAALALGLRADIEVLGYENDGAPVFARSPSARATFTLQVPPLLQVLSRLEEITEEFRDAFAPLRSLASGDFDGDGSADVLRIAKGGVFEFYAGAGTGERIDPNTSLASDFLDRDGAHEVVRKLLFERRRTQLGIESALELLRDTVSSVQAAVLAGRAPARSVSVDLAAVPRIDRVQAHDLDGDGRDDVIVYADPESDDDDEGPELAFREQMQPLYLWLSPGASARPAAASR